MIDEQVKIPETTASIAHYLIEANQTYLAFKMPFQEYRRLWFSGEVSPEALKNDFKWFTAPLNTDVTNPNVSEGADGALWGIFKFYFEKPTDC